MTENTYQVPLERTANTPISEGVHPFVVKDIEETVSQNDNPMWIVSMACETPGEEGKEVRMFLVLTDKARWKLEAFLDAVKAPASGSATASQFIGRRLRANISHKDYEGRPQAQVGEMFPVSVASNSPRPASNAGVKGATVVTKKPTATVNKKAPVGLPADAKDKDGIPF